MSIILPDFKDRKCLEVDLCGLIPAVEYDRKKNGPLPKPITHSLNAVYELSGQKVLARLVGPFPLNDEGDVHLHVNFVPMIGQKTRATNAEINDIVSRLDHFVRKKFSLGLAVKGTFLVAIAELPSYIRPMIEETSGPAGIQVRMTSGTLSLSNAPIQSISWRLLGGEPGSVAMTLEVRTEKELSESYLVEVLDKIESAFSAFVKYTG